MFLIFNVHFFDENMQETIYIIAMIEYKIIITLEVLFSACIAILWALLMLLLIFQNILFSVWYQSKHFVGKPNFEKNNHLSKFSKQFCCSMTEMMST